MSRVLIVLLTVSFCSTCYQLELNELNGLREIRRFPFHQSRGSISPKCPPGETGLFPYPPDKRKFLNCYYGESLVQECFPGTVFNSKISDCDCPHNLLTHYYTSSSSEDYESIYDENFAIANNRKKQIFLGSCGMTVDTFTECDETKTIAEKGMHPWQASILEKNQNDYQLLCGAVIVSKKFVLTAAHCCKSFNNGREQYIIVAGDYDRDEDEGTEQYARIQQCYIHKDYQKGTEINNDIAVIKLKGRGFYLGRHVQAICLPNFNFREEGAYCVISGFGILCPKINEESRQLKVGVVNIHEGNHCRHIYGKNFTKGMICATPLKGEPDTCKGDSGGPLACFTKGLFTLAGLTSWGESCGQTNKPSVYVKVAHYKCWIENIMIKHS